MFMHPRKRKERSQGYFVNATKKQASTREIYTLELRC
jgi:hypothetical protein